MVYKVLLVDDDREIHTLLSKTIPSYFELTSVYSPEGALNYAEYTLFDIIIIDLNLSSDMGGLELLEQLKTFNLTKDTFFFILTGQGNEQDEVTGHKLLVDEYIKKPVSHKVFNAILEKYYIKKENKTISEDKNIEYGPFYISPAKHQVVLNLDQGTKEVQLTKKEFKLLQKLVSNHDQVFSRETLYEDIWGHSSDSTFRTVDMHISALRKKIAPFESSIITVHAVGYKFSL